MKTEESIEDVMGRIELKGQSETKAPIKTKAPGPHKSNLTLYVAITAISIPTILTFGYCFFALRNFVLKNNLLAGTSPTQVYQPTATLSQPLQNTAVLPQATDSTPNSIDIIVNFEVKSATQKNPTGLYIQAGDMMQFSIIGGSWTDNIAGTPYTSGCGKYYDNPAAQQVWLLPPEQRGGALIGYIGSEPFFIGCQSAYFKASMSGELSLGMSDCLGCFQDNEGSLYVIVSRVSENYYNQSIINTQPTP